MEGQFDRRARLAFWGRFSTANFSNSAQVGLDRVDDSRDLSISPDYRAVATTFSKFVIETETGKGARVWRDPVGLHKAAVTGPAQAARAHFFAQGYMFADQDAVHAQTMAQ